jgi:SPP1 family predicted phage head-tail adaptor
MEAGELRHRVTLLQPSRTTNGAGETNVTRTEFRTVWASVEPLKGWQLERARQIGINTSHRVRIRYVAEVAGDWQIGWDGQVLNITGIVNPEGRNIELELSCEQEGVLTP